MMVTSFNPRTGEQVAVANETAADELKAVCARASEAAPLVAGTRPHDRREWVRAIADGLEAHRDELAALAETETALGVDRLTGEVARAANQLRFYADVAVEGSYLGVTVDPPGRGKTGACSGQPSPGARGGLRREQLPLRVQRPRQ